MADIKSDGEWKKGICSCTDATGICCRVTFAPCVAFGNNNQKMSRNCFLYGCSYLIPCVNWIVAAKTRQRIRELRGIPGDFFHDLMIHVFCGYPCALAQEGQELKDLGIQERIVLVCKPPRPKAEEEHVPTPEPDIVTRKPFIYLDDNNGPPSNHVVSGIKAYNFGASVGPVGDATPPAEFDTPEHDEMIRM